MKKKILSDDQFFFLLIFSFFFIVSEALFLSVSKIYKEQGPLLRGSFFKKKILSPAPVLKDGINEFPVLSAQSVLAVDLDSGITLFEKDPRKRIYPASTTKIITALVAMEYYPLDEVLEVKNTKIEGQKMGLVKGEKITFENLLKGLLIFSANDAAETIADNFPGGRDFFILSMNLKAKKLGLKDSHFVNPTGLDEPGHYSTAEDLVIAASHAIKNEKFAEIMGIKEITVESVDKRFKHHLVNINRLLGTDGVKGVKTGWTENARENLVAFSDKDQRRILIALLGSKDRFEETKLLLDWIFSSYSWEKVEVFIPYSP